VLFHFGASRPLYKKPRLLHDVANASVSLRDRRGSSVGALERKSGIEVGELAVASVLTSTSRYQRGDPNKVIVLVVCLPRARPLIDRNLKGSTERSLGCCRHSHQNY
jgi:hypothetical protein